MTREMKQRKTLDDKLAEMAHAEPAPIETKLEEVYKSEVIKSETITHIPVKEVEKNYALKTVGVRIDVVKDLNRDIDLLCIELEENKKDLLAKWIEEGVARTKKKLEK